MFHTAIGEQKQGRRFRSVGSGQRSVVSPPSPESVQATLQRGIGNQAVGRLLAQAVPSASTTSGVLKRKCECSSSSGALQAKLKIGSPNDPLEGEADRVAERVLRTPDPRNLGIASNDILQR